MNNTTILRLRIVFFLKLLAQFMRDICRCHVSSGFSQPGLHYPSAPSDYYRLHDSVTCPLDRTHLFFVSHWLLSLFKFLVFLCIAAKCLFCGFGTIVPSACFSLYWFGYSCFDLIWFGWLLLNWIYLHRCLWRFDKRLFFLCPRDVYV